MRRHVGQDSCNALHRKLTHHPKRPPWKALDEEKIIKVRWFVGNRQKGRSPCPGEELRINPRPDGPLDFPSPDGGGGVDNPL